MPKQGFVFTSSLEESGKNCLMIIDPQNDFMEGGSLAVKGAKQDMDRLNRFISNNKNQINSICVTLDTHSLFHIGNAYAYKDTKETITLYDPSVHFPEQVHLQEHIKDYANRLDKKGKKTCIMASALPTRNSRA